MVVEKELTIPEELVDVAKEYNLGWKTNKVTIRRLLHRDINAMTSQAVKIKLSQVAGTSTQSADVDPTLLADIKIIKSVVQAPWKAGDLNALADLPQPIVEWVQKEVDDFNTLAVKKKEKLNESSTEEPQTI